MVQHNFCIHLLTELRAMRPFQYLDQPALLDILAYVTLRYTKMFSNATMSHVEYAACRELLHLLQSEIEARRINGSKQSYSYPLPVPKQKTGPSDPV